MTSNHPITPPPELVQDWMRVGHMDIAPLHLAQALATQAARWGYQQCEAEYERAAMDIVPPTWLEDEENNDD